MKRVLTLLKKDLLLSKWYMLTAVLANLMFIPLFFLYLEPETGGTAALFPFCSFVSLYLTLASLSTPTLKFPKAELALCCAPYSRAKLVLARYAYLFCAWLVCLVIHVLWRLILPQAALPGLWEVFIALLLNAVMVSIYMPLNYRFGPKLASYFLLALYIVGLFTLFNNVFEALPVDAEGFLSRLTALPAPVLLAALLAAGLLLAGSCCLSLCIYQKKEL